GGAGAAEPVAAEITARPDDDLPEVLAEGAGQALWQRGGLGGRPAPFPGGRADPGAAGRPRRAAVALVPAEPGRGRPDGVGGVAPGRHRGRRLGGQCDPEQTIAAGRGGGAGRQGEAVAGQPGPGPGAAGEPPAGAAL